MVSRSWLLRLAFTTGSPTEGASGPGQEAPVHTRGEPCTLVWRIRDLHLPSNDSLLGSLVDKVCEICQL